MKIAEKRKQLFDSLTPVLKPKGFKLFKTGGNPCYIYYKNDIAIDLGFNFFKLGDITFSSYGITHYEVEDYILALNKFPEVFKEKKKDHLNTVYQWETKCIHGFDANTPEEIEQGIELINTYINGEGQTFLDTYMYLPNILKRMDELEAKGSSWQDILAGTLDAYFRVLIISKLCNDSNYESKKALVDLIFEKPGYENWIPFYEKLKLVLPTIQPKYNLDH
ncbi:hypothetical protein [Tamlana sp. I1]|uniref:hypothetical protein n=1 Tax=Tamlana sp. I1 TaxID=2762061 RepID=UPI00188F11B4|nr:hypothetical protein [Tamlana sp. I1]